MKPLTLREALLLLLDQVDYTAGACRVNSMVGAVLDQNVLTLVKEALVQDAAEHQTTVPDPSLSE